MSSRADRTAVEESEYKETWLDTYWPVLVISYGVAFIMILANWAPR